MKIAIVIFADFLKGGASVSRVKLMGKGLAGCGHSVHIIVPQKLEPGLLSQEIEGLQVRWGCCVTPATWNSISARLEARLAALRLIRDLAAKGLDWLILYNVGLDGIAFLFTARRHGARVAAEYCDVFPSRAHPHLEDRARHCWRSMSDLLVPRFTQLNFVISKFLETRMQKLAPSTPTAIIPPLVDLDQFQVEVARGIDFRKRWRLGDAVVIGYLGSFWSVNGVAVLLRASHQLVRSKQKFKLVIGGMGLKELDCDDVPRLVQELELQNVTTLTGWMSIEEVISAMSAADVLVIPQIESMANLAGLPTKLAEYLAMGRAVVASCVGDIPLYLSHEENALLCQPGNADSLAQALRRIINDRGLRERLGENARATATKYFSYRQAGLRIEAAMQSVSSGTTGRNRPGS